MKAKIIIVEDHEPIRNELSILLSKYGYEIIAIEHFDTVLEDCLRENADLILLDINLPLYDGYYVCRAIREKSEVPIIVVTSRDSEMDELMSMNLGADDFVTKPYNTQILLARISAMLKRTRKEEVENSVQYHGLKLQLNNSTVVYEDQVIELSKNEMRILYTLLQNKGKIVSRDHLMETLWQSNEFIDDNTLTVNVNRVRKKLESAGLKDFIKTKRGQGYMRLRRFLSIYYAQMATHFIFLCLIEGLLYIFEVNRYLMIYLLVIGILLELIYLGQQYMKKFRYYKEMTIKLDMLDQKNMLSEMMERPDFFEGEFIYDILQSCNKSMNDEILQYRTEAAGYREYIEMWIHEVKTPLAAAKLILENHPSEITEAIDEALQQINYYLEQALYYARSNSVEKDYLVKELNLKDMVQKAVRFNARIMISNKIKISMNNLDQKIFSDEKWLLFILNQIISNAVKYKKEDPQISFEARQSTNQIFLEIRDNGIGIAAKDLPRVTDKGYTGTTGRNYEKSTGMGLYLCKKLCDKLQLSFKIESKEEEYTIVTIGFPRSSMIFLNE